MPWLLLAAVVLLGSLNVLLLVRYSPPEGAVSEVQYQSLLYSVAAANYYLEQGVHLVDGLKPGPPVRFEDLAVDDVGYPIGLSWAAALGIVRFSQQTRDFVGQDWELDESREFMYATLRKEIQRLNRVLFGVTAVILAALLIVGALVLPRRSSARNAALAISVVILLAGFVIPHLVPRLVVYRLHVHGVVATLVLIGTASAAGLAWALSPQLSSRRGVFFLRLAMAFASGVLLATVLWTRRSEGFVWMAIVFGLILYYLGKSVRDADDRVRALAAHVGLLIVFGLGYALPGVGVSSIVATREMETSNLVGELQPPRHPIYHSTLIGISRSPRNSLGIASEEDVVVLVQRETGIEGDAFSDEYDDASKQVYLNYVTSHPIEYLLVLVDNTDETIGYMLFLAGIAVEPFGQLMLAGTIALGLIASVVVMWRRGREFRFLAIVMSTYLLLSFGIALATTSPAAYGPTTATILVIGLGVAASKAGTRSRPDPSGLSQSKAYLRDSGELVHERTPNNTS